MPGARVAVMGGSLGGLTAALVLRDAGCDVDVYERSRAPLRDRGAGIVLHPATIRYLVSSRRRAQTQIGVPARVLRYLDADGNVASEQPCRYRFTSYYALYADLLACMDSDRYHLGCEVTGFEASDDGVEVKVGDHVPERVDMLVCADGVRSAAREQLLPEVVPAYAGYVGWRGALRESQLGSAFTALHGAIAYHVLRDSHVLTYPIPAVGDGQGRMLNWLWYRNVPDGQQLDDVLTDRDGVRRSASVPPGRVRDAQLDSLRADAAALLPAPLADVIEATESPFVQTVFDVEVPRMAFGRVCLIGDAAFALRPHVAAGTAKAAEDGWRLAEALSACDHDVPAALERWEPGQLELGRDALDRTREAGERAQFRNTWRVGDPLPFGLYRQGDSALE